MPLQLSNQLKSMIEINKTSSSRLRCLVNGLIKSNNNADTLLKAYPIIEQACQGWNVWTYFCIQFVKIIFI
jgi:hypothetical protein